MRMNLHGVRAIYRFEIARTLRTITQSVIAPVLTTSLYFIVFGTAIGSRMGDIDNVSYGAFIIPGLVMLSLLNESISNTSFGIYMLKWSGTIYELLSAPVSWFEVLLGYVGAAATKSMVLGLLILATARQLLHHAATHGLGEGHPVGLGFFPMVEALKGEKFGCDDAHFCLLRKGNLQI